MHEEQSERSFEVVKRRSDELEVQIDARPRDFRVLTGDRPTGPLHLGHYFGTLARRVELQNKGVEVIVLIADYQALTDRCASANVRTNVRELTIDYLAAGIDPAKATIFTHGSVPALNQLMLPFLGLVTVSELQRNPTVKAEIAALNTSAVSGLMFTYPVHQAADILFCKANLVPVGRDQIPHVEMTRTVARRFNDRYCDGQAFFPEPDALLSKAPLLLGIDGTKMSKSRNNAINLSATADETATLIRRARTDTERFIAYDPVNRPEVANLLLLASLCTGSTPESVADGVATKGASGLKDLVTVAVNEFLRPLRERRKQLTADRTYVDEILAAGNERAFALARNTLDEVQTAMHMLPIANFSTGGSHT